MRRLIVASLVAGFFIAGAAMAPTPTSNLPRACFRVLTVRQGEHVASLVFAGTRRISASDWRWLYRAKHCESTRRERERVRRFAAAAHRARAERLHPPLAYGQASWYYDGAIAYRRNGYPYGVAVCGSGGGPCVPFGTRIEIHYGGRVVVAIADDHGPYVPGRVLDLGQSTAQALGLGGLGTVGYRIM